MHRIRVVSRASSRPFRGGGTLVLVRRGHPPKSPLQGGPQGQLPSGHPQTWRNEGLWRKGTDTCGGGAALLRLPWRVRLRGLYFEGQAGATHRPPWPPEPALPCGFASSGACSSRAGGRCASPPLAPRASAALRVRGSGALSRACRLRQGGHYTKNNINPPLPGPSTTFRVSRGRSPWSPPLAKGGSREGSKKV